MTSPLRFLLAAVPALVVTTPAKAGEPVADIVRASATITVTATGEAAARPDTALITLGVSVQKEAAGAAVDAMSAAMTAVLDRLAAAGVAAKDMQTATLSLTPVYSPAKSDAPPRVLAYRASNTVRLRTADLDRLGALIDIAMGAGANRLDNIAFSFADPSALLDKARRDAVRKAIAKADLYAAEAGVRRGRLLKMSETGRAVPTPRFAAARLERAVPITPGQSRLSVTVTMTWRIE